MKSLYSISAELELIRQSVIDNDGELTEDLEKQLFISEAELQQKAINYALAIKNIEAEEYVIKSEIDRLKKLKDRRAKLSSKLKENIKYAMDRYEVPKIESPTINLSLRTSKSLIIEDDAEVPAKFVTIVQQTKIDKMAIKKEMKEGLKIDGVYIQENKNLHIK